MECIFLQIVKYIFSFVYYIGGGALSSYMLYAPQTPYSWFRGWDPRGKGKREGRGRWDWDPSTRDGKGGEGNGGKDGGRRVGKGMGRKGREGEEISIHGLKLNLWRRPWFIMFYVFMCYSNLPLFKGSSNLAVLLRIL